MLNNHALLIDAEEIKLCLPAKLVVRCSSHLYVRCHKVAVRQEMLDDEGGPWILRQLALEIGHLPLNAVGNRRVMLNEIGSKDRLQQSRLALIIDRIVNGLDNLFVALLNAGALRARW